MKNKDLEKSIFLRISKKIQSLDSAVDTIACFETLCGVRSITQLQEKIADICTMEEARAADSTKDWSNVRKWAQWWTRSTS